MTRSVRAKFYVSSLTPADGATAADVLLHPVCRGVENSMWAQYTPGGSIQMRIKNPLAAESFVVGQEYEVLFTPTAKPAPGDGHPFVHAEDKYGAIVCETCGLQVGYTAKGVETYPHLKGHDSQEKIAEGLARHDEFYAKVE